MMKPTVLDCGKHKEQRSPETPVLPLAFPFAFSQPTALVWED